MREIPLERAIHIFIILQKGREGRVGVGTFSSLNRYLFIVLQYLRFIYILFRIIYLIEVIMAREWEDKENAVRT